MYAGFKTTSRQISTPPFGGFPKEEGRRDAEKSSSNAALRCLKIPLLDAFSKKENATFTPMSVVNCTA